MSLLVDKKYKCLSLTGSAFKNIGKAKTVKKFIHGKLIYSHLIMSSCLVHCWLTNEWHLGLANCLLYRNFLFKSNSHLTLQGLINPVSAVTCAPGCPGLPCGPGGPDWPWVQTWYSCYKYVSIIYSFFHAFSWKSIWRTWLTLQLYPNSWSKANYSQLCVVQYGEIGRWWDPLFGLKFV